MKETLWSKKKNQVTTACTKNSLRLLAMGVQRQCSVEDTCLRILSCSRIREKRGEPRVPEVKVPVVECLDCHARITSKELAPIHSVISGTLQNACSTRPRVVADLEKSALLHFCTSSD